jgi:steroid 5-alpha reductase family enzyme
MIELIVVSLILQLMLFIPAFLFKTDKLTDFSYSLGFVILTVFVYLRNEYSLYKIILVAMVTVWALRLGYYLVLRIRKTGKDKRFDKIRINFWRFLQFWIFQGLVIPFVLLPTFYFLASEGKFSWMLVIGGMVWLSGLLIEGFADDQKFRYKNKPENNNIWIDTGLWKYSRHPNYLGEIMCWIGIYLFAYGSLSAAQKIYGVISPLVIAALLLFISGIPILEKKADEKWKESKDYQKYKKRTAILIPFVY